MRTLVMIACAALALIGGGSMPSRLQNAQLQKELDALSKRGYTYRMLDNNLVEITNPMTGTRQLKSLNEPSEAEIRAWASSRGVPIIEIDPSTVDTSQFVRWFRPWAQVPLSNIFLDPVVVTDIDRNGKAEVYGEFLDNGKDAVTMIYEVDSTARVTRLYHYPPYASWVRELTDVDADSLFELTFHYKGFYGRVINYEQASKNSLPTSQRFIHRRYQSVHPAESGIYFGDLDKDSLTDFLYKGSEPDSIWDGISKIYVAEYGTDTANFTRVWSTNLGLESVSGVGGFAVGDFDGDRMTEFAMTEIALGHIYVVENTGDNTFSSTWQDSVPFVNLYYVGSGDVDNDKKPEFFVGATIFNGDWTIMFEADSNNHYSPKLMIHLLSGGTFDNPQYVAT
jgi:hypothetical protein